MIIELILGLVAGAFLGLLGGGGSAITVPMLIYVLGLGTKSAIGTSLIVVAIATTIGAYAQCKAGHVEIKIATIFGLMGAITSFAGAMIARALPDAIQLYILASLMVISAIAMQFFNADKQPTAPIGRLTPAVTVASVVGLLTGIVGVGGGFMLVPALAILMKLPLSTATGTSLAIVAANSAIAGLAYMPYVPRDLSLLTVASGMSIACPIVGRMATRLNETTLRRAFSTALILLACLIFIKPV